MNTTTVTQKDCRKNFSNQDIEIHSGFLCTKKSNYDEFEWPNAGSGLIDAKDGKLIGIFFWTNIQLTSKNRGVFTRVQPYLKWISNQTEIVY